MTDDRIPCECGETFGTHLEHHVHRTEDHGTPQAVLNNMEPGEFERIVDASNSVQEVADATGWTRVRILALIGAHGLDDRLTPNASARFARGDD